MDWDNNYFEVWKSYFVENPNCWHLQFLFDVQYDATLWRIHILIGVCVHLTVFGTCPFLKADINIGHFGETLWPKLF